MNCFLASNGTENSNKNTKLKPFLSKRNDGSNVSDHFKSFEFQHTYYSKIQFKEYCLGTDAANRWFLTKDNRIVHVVNIIRDEQTGDINLCCVEVKNKSQFFILPIKSTTFDIYCAPQSDVYSKEKVLFRLNYIKCKLVCLPHHDLNVYIPLLHSKLSIL